MSRDTEELQGRPKRPYEAPRLEPSAVFGAEGAAGTCCRGSGISCANSLRDTKRITIDSNKQKNSVAS